MREWNQGTIVKTPYDVYRAVWHTLFARLSGGVNVFDREWDILVVLNGCRVDTLQEVLRDYPWIGPVESVRSVGSQSKQQLAKTFVPERRDTISRTTYVTANPFTENVFEESENNRGVNPANQSTVDAQGLDRLVELWRTAWDDDLGTVPPRAVTDTAIDLHRSTDPERLMVHYMQPHEPFLTSEGPIENVQERVREGTLQIKEAKEHYRTNVRLVLDEVDVLRRSIDADTIAVTANHGNAFGEWRIYGHPIGFQHPVVKRVPWTEFSATDDGGHTPAEWDEEQSESSVRERLEALGYR